MPQVRNNVFPCSVPRFQAQFFLQVSIQIFLHVLMQCKAFLYSKYSAYDHVQAYQFLNLWLIQARSAPDDQILTPDFYEQL